MFQQLAIAIALTVLYDRYCAKIGYVEWVHTRYNWFKSDLCPWSLWMEATGQK